MNQHLQNILNRIQEDTNLSAEEKSAILKSLKDADKEFEITSFKLDRTEKVKRTTAILLEETIEELEQKRKAVEAQNRELEIESSLERVRTVAMSMSKPDDMLNICEILFSELKALGFSQLRNAIIHTFVDEKKYLIDYDYSDYTGEAISRIPYKGNTVVEKFIKEIRKSSDAFITGKEFEEFKLFRISNNEALDPRLDTISSLCYYFYSVGTGAIGISTFDPISNDKQELLKRFRNVFELAYQRYSDIEKAEAQAREAQIELALERVRARTMAMQYSGELADASFLLDSQVRALGIKTWGCAFNIYGENESTEWFSSKAGTMPAYKTPREKIFLRYYEAGQRGEAMHIEEYAGETCVAHYNYLCTVPVMGDALKEVIANGGSFPTCQIDHATYFKYGYLLFITFEPVPDAHDIFIRFAKVFEQTYTRFLDLQKAEAQSRESQIQLALERVRARTMAMQKSDQLSETVYVLFQQFKELGENPDQATIGVINEDEKVIEYWVTMYGNQINKVFKFSIDEPNVTNKIYKTWKENKKSLTIDLSGEALTEFMTYRAGKGGAAINADEKRRIINVAFFSKGLLNVQSNEECSEESIILLERFAKVFEQTYTRFLDLQKAEAQSRESQIQLALERVRARTMAMQRSDELQEAASLMFQQIEFLGAPTWNCSFNIWTEDKKYAVAWNATKEGFGRPFYSPSSEDVFLEFYTAAQQGKELFIKEIGGQELEQHYQYLSAVPGVGETIAELKAAGIALPTFQIFNIAYFTQGYLMFITYKPVPELWDIFKRFAKVFEQTYTRFLDLQKAEAQARESRIEAALERVRSRSLAMHKTSEIQEVIHTVHDELLKLNISIVGGSFIVINKDVDAKLYAWGSGGTADTMAEMLVPDFGMPFCTNLIKGIKKGSGFFTEEFSRQEKIEYFTELFKHEPWSTLPAKEKQAVLESEGAYTRSVSVSKHTSIFIINQNGRKFTEAENDIVKRFAKVFEQAYTRFLDLQKAEAQSRESQIQLALERVRARTMAMQHSDELTETANLLFKQVQLLDLPVVSCGFNIWQKEDKVCNAYMSDEAGLIQPPFKIPLTESPVFIHFAKSKQKEESFYEEEISSEALAVHYKYMLSIPVFAEIANNFLKAGFTFPEFQINNVANFAFGNLIFITYKAVPEAHDIFKRFGKTFEQTYTRFLDLQKAESQARESQIETALERVRAIAMSMMKSDELMAVCEAVFKQLQTLGFTGVRAAQIYIRHDDEEKFLNYDYSDNAGADVVEVTYNSHPNTRRIYDVIKNAGDGLIDNAINKQQLDEWKSYLYNTLKQPKEKELDAATELHYYLYSFGMGAFGICTFKSINDDELQILERFRNVFSLSYKRYVDIALAEAQAREAQIEAALERVRGKAMAMHNSNDLSSTASVVFTELRKLGISPIRCGVGLLNKKSRNAQLYSATSSADGDSLALIGWVELSGHPVLKNIYDTWVKNEEYFPELSGGQLKSYYELLLKGLPVKGPEWQSAQKQFGTFLPFTIGCLYAWSESPYNAAEIKILKRFANIIDLTFRRYIDLQKAEASAKEAIKQAALDRIRADIASMRTIKDLERITPLIWNELNILGVPFIRCGVFLMDEKQQLIHTFLSTPDGKAIAAFHIPYNTPGNIKHVISHWHDNKNYIDHWDENAFTDFANMLVTQGALTSSKQYLKTIPHGGFYLHFLPFLQGMLYVGNTTQLSEEEINLIQSLADAFSTAYARYEDFNKLEAAKKQVDRTLVELKQTQQQLVQSEKMASLGELTAGIAHEIQNPLNFVNNFSEINAELINELKEEATNKNYEEVIAIADDIKKNEQKIIHHGKRADAIVKGMLQHSRKNTGQKEPTDINALCDEYLRLSYHGLRAKDKNFNADFKTNFDESIGKINIVPQDIGRVLLNLFNNAFYAVNEKQKLTADGYQPTAKVKTRRINDKVEIVVSDNGNGIPQSIIDKIFQPFFTTKPTGQGTGLGLSLAYDIIKAHGGEIKVESFAGRETKFIINLPKKSA